MGILFSIIVGRGFGTAMGSVLTHKYGLRIAYMIGGCLAGVTAIVYLILYRLFLKKIREDRMAVKSDALTHENRLQWRFVYAYLFLPSGHSKEVFGVENPAAELQEDSSISKMNWSLNQSSHHVATLGTFKFITHGVNWNVDYNQPNEYKMLLCSDMFFLLCSWKPSE